MIQFTLITILCGTLAGFSMYGTMSGGFDHDDTTQAIAIVLTVACSVLTVAAVLALVTLPKRKHNLPAIAVDAKGVWWVHRRHTTLTTWRDLVAVGTSYKVSPRDRTQAGSVPHRRAYAFEAYLRDPKLPSHPDSAVLRRWLVTEQPPRPELPQRRLRYIMPVAGVRNELHRVVAQHAPHLWLGDYERTWNPVSVRDLEPHDAAGGQAEQPRG